MPSTTSDEAGFDNDFIGEEQDFDAFDVGSIWTQVASTQFHRDRWNRGEALKPRLSQGEATLKEGADDLDATATQPLHNDDDVFNAATEGRSTSPQNSQNPWWKKGKTAPLLDQYDEQRRMWYMIQAGVYDHSSSVHDAVAPQETLTLDLTEDEPTTIVETASAPLAARTPSRGTADASTSDQPASIAASAPQRAALSLAGNVNWPMVSAQVVTPIMQTPKRKTWSSTMAQRQLAASTPSSASSSAKKRKTGKLKAQTSRSSTKK